MKIVFARRPTLGSWLIRIGTWSQWSHCAVIDGDTVIDATWPHGVRRTLLADWVIRYADNEVANIQLPHEDAATGFLVRQIGRRYDWTALVGFFFRRGWKDEDRWFCSELVEAAVMAGGLRRFREQLTRITPRDVWMVTP